MDLRPHNNELQRTRSASVTRSAALAAELSVRRTELMEATAEVATATTSPGASPSDRKALVLLAMLCVPGVVASFTLALDNITRSLFGSSFTTWGFLGGLVGLAAFLAGFLSILTWPGVVLLSLRSVKAGRLRLLARIAVVVGCIVATYSAAFFMVWFVILPLSAR